MEVNILQRLGEMLIAHREKSNSPPRALLSGQSIILLGILHFPLYSHVEAVNLFQNSN